MSQIEINHYLVEISPDSPCGDYLEFDPDYQEMERLSKGSPEIQYGESITAPAEEGDWQAVRKKALSLLERTRDVYVAMYLAMAEARLGSLSGVSQSLALIAGLLDRFWDDVHPVKDPEDSYPILRMNALASLNDFERFIKPIRNIPLTASKILPFSLRDYEITVGKIEPVSGESKAKLTEDQLIASFKDSSAESLKRNLQWIEAILASLEVITRITTEKAGAHAAPNLSALTGQLKAMKQVFDKYTEIQTDMTEPEPDSEDPDNERSNEPGVENLSANQVSPDVNAPITMFDSGDGSMPGITSISNREQVREAIDLICGYFEINEPASPIPLLLKRAQGLLEKDFIEILQDLAPDGVNQAANVCGIGNAEQN